MAKIPKPGEARSSAKSQRSSVAVWISERTNASLMLSKLLFGEHDGLQLTAGMAAYGIEDCVLQAHYVAADKCICGNLFCNLFCRFADSALFAAANASIAKCVERCSSGSLSQRNVPCFACRIDTRETSKPEVRSLYRDTIKDPWVRSFPRGPPKRTLPSWAAS